MADFLFRKRRSLQVRLFDWVLRCFGEKIAYCPKERAARVMEECSELSQACGLSYADALCMVTRAYMRPKGEVHQELAGAFHTLSALASAHGLDINEVTEQELLRVELIIDKVRQKNLAKPPVNHDAQDGDLAQMVEQLREFANGRPVRLLTRKANSKADSSVAYETVFPKDIENGTCQLFLRCDKDEVVAAVFAGHSAQHVDFWSQPVNLSDK